MGSKKQPYTQRKFRAGTFFAGLLSLFLAAAIVAAFGFAGVDAILEGMRGTAAEAVLSAGFSTMGPLAMISLGLVLAVPVALYGIVDLCTAFQLDYVYKRSLFYEIVFTLVAAGLSYGLFYVAPSLPETAKLLFWGCGAGAATVAGLRALTLLWFSIRCMAGKAQTRPPYFPIEGAAADKPKEETKKKQAAPKHAAAVREDDLDTFKDVRTLKTTDDLDDL